MTIKKQYLFNASPVVLFDALMCEECIEQWTGSKATMEPHAEGKFILWDGSILGLNVLVTKKRIIQLWKEASWDNYSEVMFQLVKVESGTDLRLIQNGVPEDAFKAISSGWDDYYFQPIKNYVESIKSNK